jgi:hypothetical protein
MSIKIRNWEAPTKERNPAIRFEYMNKGKPTKLIYKVSVVSQLREFSDINGTSLKTIRTDMEQRPGAMA